VKIQPLRVLCGEPQNYSKAGLDIVGSFAHLDAVTLSQTEFNSRAAEYDVLMVRLQLRVDRALIESAPSVRAVLSPTTGLNHIDLAAAEEHAVTVFHLRGETEFLKTITSTAEHTWALLLALIRNVPHAFESVQVGEWEQRPFRGRELKGKTLGIVGLGRLGRIVARYGWAFGMRVVAYDPYVMDVPDYVESCSGLRALMEQSDVLSIHVPLNETTSGMIGAQQLAWLPEGAVVVNTARGELLDELAILDGLSSGRIAGFAADVLADEHHIREAGHPLVDFSKTHQNVLITPHIAGAAVEAIEQTDLFIINRLKNWLTP
jgi:D-3-phosphoglycerate dehydrogenase